MERPFVVLVLLLTGAAGCQGRKPGAQEPGARSDHLKADKRATDEASAVELYREHLRKIGRSPDRLAISARRFGGRWLIYSTPARMQPSIKSLSVMDSEGKVFHDLMDGLACCHMNEFRSSEDPAEHRRLVESFVSLHCGDGDLGEPVYLSTTSDIPGYKKKPLPEDVEGVIRPMWSHTDHQGGLVYVVSTYTHIGGHVRRYTFLFDKGRSFRRATCIELGRGIGDAIYYE